MTVHWINDELMRESFVLGFNRVKGSHTFIVIASHVYEIHVQFNIDRKVTDTVTDNARNFEKAFKIFQDSDDTNIQTNSNVDSNSKTASSDDDDSDDLNIDMPSFVDLVLDSCDDSLDISLPTQMRCCSHTMNLVATVDVENTVKNAMNANFKKQYRSVFAKLRAFFNISHRSTKSQDIIYDVCQCRFPNPVVTRWNSLFDAVKKIQERKEDIIKVFDKLKLTSITILEWEFLKEYVDIMTPVAYAIDYFQGTFAKHLYTHVLVI